MPLPVLPLIFDFLRALWALLKDRETRGAVYLVIVVLISGMLFYHSVEGWTWLDSLYFSVITLTTVGYGDLSPQTDGGKVFTMIYIFVGLGILAGFITLIAQKRQEGGQRLLTRRRNRRNGETADEESAVEEEPGS